MNARSQRLTGAARCDSLGWVKREWKGAVHASGFWPFLSVRIVGYMGGTGGHHHLRSPKNVSKRWGSPQWEQTRNRKQKSVEWHLSTQDARIKLKRLYPQFQMG
jgi:hypothetical protein